MIKTAIIGIVKKIAIEIKKSKYLTKNFLQKKFEFNTPKWWARRADYDAVISFVYGNVLD